MAGICAYGVDTFPEKMEIILAGRLGENKPPILGSEIKIDGSAVERESSFHLLSPSNHALSLRLLENSGRRGGCEDTKDLVLLQQRPDLVRSRPTNAAPRQVLLLQGTTPLGGLLGGWVDVTARSLRWCTEVGSHHLKRTSAEPLA